MDPQVAWEAMLDDCDHHDWTAAAEHAEALVDWLDRGGFPPQTIEARELRPEIHRAIAIAACQLVLKKAARAGTA